MDVTFGEEKKRNYRSLPVFVFSAVYFVAALPPWVGRQPGECRGAQDAAVTHFWTQTVNSVAAHTLRWASSVLPSTWSMPGCARLVGTAQGCRQQSQLPCLQCFAALLMFISEFCKSGAQQIHWNTCLCAWAHTRNNCKWGWVGSLLPP